jgi:hypothetical protein
MKKSLSTLLLFFYLLTGSVPDVFAQVPQALVWPGYPGNVAQKTIVLDPAWTGTVTLIAYSSPGGRTVSAQYQPTFSREGNTLYAQFSAIATRSLSNNTYVELATGGTVRYKGYLSLSYNGAVPPTSPATPSLIITPDLVQGLTGILDSKADTATFVRKTSYEGFPISITSGTGYTLPSGNVSTYVTVNPPTALTSLIITLPVGTRSSFVYIGFGGTITTGKVVNALTVVAAAGQFVLQLTSSFRVESGESIAFRFNPVNSTWYRIY